MQQRKNPTRRRKGRRARRRETTTTTTTSRGRLVTVLFYVFAIVNLVHVLWVSRWVFFSSYFGTHDDDITTVPTSALKEDPASMLSDMERQKINNTVVDSKKQCNVLVAHGPDPYSGLATLLYTYPINFMLLSQERNMTLWIDYKKSRNDKYYDPSYGENVFEYYFQPIDHTQYCSHSNNGMSMEHNKNNNIQFTNLSETDVFPDLHYKLDDLHSVHAWYYHWKHYNNKNVKWEYYYEDWYSQQRSLGYSITSKYLKLRTDIATEAQGIWRSLFGWGHHDGNSKNDDESSHLVVLGIHMRGTDKAAHRRKIKPEEYYPYIKAFFVHYGSKARLFVATDDSNYLDQLKRDWNTLSDEKFDEVVKMQSNVLRSNTGRPLFNLKVDSKYEMGKQALMDILLLSKCDWFIHGASSMSEAVFYNNIMLHNHSVHLEYTENRQRPFWMYTSTVESQTTNEKENVEIECIMLHKFHALKPSYKERILLATQQITKCWYIALYWIDSREELSESQKDDLQWLEKHVGEMDWRNNPSKKGHFIVDPVKTEQAFPKFQSAIETTNWLRNTRSKWPWEMADVPELVWFYHHSQLFDTPTNRDKDIWIVEYDVGWKGNVQILMENLSEQYKRCDYVGFDCFTKYPNWLHYPKHTESYAYNISNGEPFSCLIQMVVTRAKVLSRMVQEFASNALAYCEIRGANLCHKRDDCNLCDFYRETPGGRKDKNKNFGTFYSSSNHNSTEWNKILNDDSIPASFWHNVK